MSSSGTIVFNTFDIQPANGADILRGMLDAFNLSGSTRQDFAFSPSAYEADLAAQECDWRAVGADLDYAIKFQIG